MHVVPNPTHPSNETRDLIKTVAITSAVSSIVGVFAIAGGQALWALLRRAIKGPKKNPRVAQAQPHPQPAPEQDYEGDEEDEMPDALKFEPRLRHTGPRRRKPGVTNEDLRRMLDEFEGRIEQRLRNTERRVEGLYEEEPDDEEDAA